MQIEGSIPQFNAEYAPGKVPSASRLPAFSRLPWRDSLVCAWSKKYHSSL
jgi:hypothetical protein